MNFDPEVLASVVSAQGHVIYRFSDFAAGQGPPQGEKYMETPHIDLSFVSALLRLPSLHTWSDYDAEADVLYLSFEKPQCANDSIMEDDGNIYHYRDGRLVGITLPNAQQRFRWMSESDPLKKPTP